MPNWAEWVLKLRSSRQYIKKFLMEDLEASLSLKDQLSKILGDEVEIPEVNIKERSWGFIMTAPDGFYIKETDRAFIENDIEWFFGDENKEVLTINSFKQAWNVDAEEFAKISKKYNLDIKIYAFEKGKEFNQDIEIHKGNIIKNDTITFDDYQWECLFPDLGG